MSSRKWVVVALVVSALLNVCLIGVFIGRHIATGMGPPMQGNPRFGVLRWAHTLPEARKRELADVLTEYRRAARPDIRALRGHQSDLRDAMLSEPLDREAVLEALTALNTSLRTGQRAGHEALVRVLEALSVEERRALDEHLQKRRMRPRGPHP